MTTDHVYTYSIDALDLDQALFRARVTRQTSSSPEPETMLTLPSVDELNNPIRDYLHNDLRDHHSMDQDRSILDLAGNPADPGHMQRALERLGVMPKGASLRMSDGTWGYSVNQSERGEFHADVRDLSDTTVYEIHSRDAFDEAVETGIMKHFLDLDGLGEHLAEVGVIGRDHQIMTLRDFEAHQRDVIADGEQIASLSRMRDAIYANADYVQNSDIIVDVNREFPMVSIHERDCPENGVCLQEHSAEPFINEAQRFSEEAVIPIEDAYLAAAAPYADALEPTQGPAMAP